MKFEMLFYGHVKYPMLLAPSNLPLPDISQKTSQKIRSHPFDALELSCNERYPTELFHILRIKPVIPSLRFIRLPATSCKLQST